MRPVGGLTDNSFSVFPIIHLHNSRNNSKFLQWWGNKTIPNFYNDEAFLQENYMKIYDSDSILRAVPLQNTYRINYDKKINNLNPASPLTWELHLRLAWRSNPCTGWGSWSWGWCGRCSSDLLEIWPRCFCKTRTFYSEYNHLHHIRTKWYTT